MDKLGRQVRMVEMVICDFSSPSEVVTGTLLQRKWDANGQQSPGVLTIFTVGEKNLEE